MSDERKKMMDEIAMRQAKCIQDYNIISKQFRVLVEKMEALDPPKKKQKRSAKNSGAGTSAPPPPAAPYDQKAAYKELGVTIRGFLKELGEEDIKEEAEARGSNEQVPMASVGDNN